MVSVPAPVVGAFVAPVVGAVVGALVGAVVGAVVTVEAAPVGEGVSDVS